MVNDLSVVYLSRLAAKPMIEDAIYGKSTPKRKSRIKALIKKIIK